MSLYTLYRPRDWSSLIGQDTISTILRTSLIQGRVGHAYILTGSRGTGKTTTARILAKWVNCLDLQDGNPCHTCAHCIAFDEGNMLDCIEIDGASNNWVENVRDLIEKARFEPNIGTYKIYIIDEVHMLSTGAFNALLKTLEEPPKHVKFILATTEIDKVPETIRSRSLRFDFKKISEADIVKRLEYVCGKEWIKADTEALEIISRAARGALRDALTLTEQNTVNQEISTEYVRSTLSLIEDSLIEEIISTIRANDRVKMIQILDSLRVRHAEVRWLFDQILYSLRDAMMMSFAWADDTSFAEYSDIFAIFESAYSKIKTIADDWLLIEITLMRAVARGEKTHDENSEMIASPISKWKKEVNSEGLGRETVWVSQISIWEFWGSIREDFSKKSQTVWATAHPTSISNATKSQRGSFWDLWNQAENRSQNETEEIKTFDTFGHKSIEKTIWKEGKIENSHPTFNYIRLLEEIKKIKATLVLDLKTARFDRKDTTLTLIFSQDWHYNRANTPAMRNIIAETLETLYTGTWNITCRIEWLPESGIADEVF